MNDRDFLGYFNQLGSKNIQNVKQASNNIVSTLLALDTKVGRKASMDATDEKEMKIKQKAEESISPSTSSPSSTAPSS